MAVLLTSNTSETTLTANSVIPLGNVVHEFGNGIRLNGDAIRITGFGYYLFNVDVAMDVTGVGAVTVQLYENGVPIPGASSVATPAAAGAAVDISFPWIIRSVPCCSSAPKNITVVVSGAGVLDSITVAVTKV